MRSLVFICSLAGLLVVKGQDVTDAPLGNDTVTEDPRVTELEMDLHQCRKQLGDSARVSRCDGDVRYVGSGVFGVTGERGRWPDSGLCVVDYAARGEEDSAYTLAVDLYIDDPDRGHIGVFYNAQDNDNFDAVFFSITQWACNYFTGSYINGTIAFNKLGKARRCPADIFVRQWVTVSVTVAPDNDVPDIRFAGQYVMDYAMIFPRKAMGGVLVVNRFNNIMLFRNYHLS